ncbi:MAG: DUF6036 family nucleotidyltransferase [Candidatus Aminicenantales bacterium]
MRVEKDFKEFIALLNKNRVRYLIVGGFAYSFYAEPRFTKDIDIFIESSKENAEKILKSIKNFGFTDITLTYKDFLEPDQITQLGIAPLRIDIITSIRGVDFQSAWKNRVIGRYGDIETYFISKADLIKNKQASGRKQDLADIEKLEKI